MPAASAAEWLTAEEAIAHIRACIWWKPGTLGACPSSRGIFGTNLIPFEA
jgi:hypothetical protein